MTTYLYFKAMYELGGNNPFSLAFFKAVEWTIWWKYELV